MGFRRRAASLVLRALSLSSCASLEGPPLDAATEADVGVEGAVDAGLVDGGAVDAGLVDGGAVDAGLVDASPSPDAGAPKTPSLCPELGLDPSAGAVHYVCDCGALAAPGCVPGDDAAAGDDPSRAWRSIGHARAAFETLAPGDSIALCRGGAFTIDASTGSRWNDARCRADRPCVVRDYVPAGLPDDAPRPILSDTSGRAIAFEDGGAADHEEGYVFLHLDLRGAGAGVGVFVYNDVDDVLLCDVSISGFAIGVQVAGSNAPGPGSDGRNARVVLRGATVTDNVDQGWLGGCDGCAIEASTFDHNGFGRAILDHHIYFTSPNDTPTVGMRAVGNTLTRAALVDGRCQGVALVAHGLHDDLLVEGNVIREVPGAAAETCWGIAVDSGYASAEGFRRAVIRGNTILHVGNVGVGLSACEDCVVEDNVVVQGQAFGTLAIAAPDRARGPEDAAMRGVVVRNNSILLGPDAGRVGVLLTGDGGGHRLHSNAIAYLGRAPDWACVSFGAAPWGVVASDHNLCASTSGVWLEGVGDLAATQRATGMDSASRAVDPGFASASVTAPDLRAGTAASPLVDAGDPDGSSPVDFDGRPRDARPDVGAYERR